MSHKHDCCEVISGISLPLLEVMYPQRETSAAPFRQAIVAQGTWRQQLVASATEKSSFRPASRPV
jgi:mannose/fructose-specific phosphotransferase system component IIA